MGYKIPIKEITNNIKNTANNIFDEAENLIESDGTIQGKTLYQMACALPQRINLRLSDAKVMYNGKEYDLLKKNLNQNEFYLAEDFIKNGSTTLILTWDLKEYIQLPLIKFIERFIIGSYTKDRLLKTDFTGSAVTTGGKSYVLDHDNAFLVNLKSNKNKRLHSLFKGEEFIDDTTQALGKQTDIGTTMSGYTKRDFGYGYSLRVVYDEEGNVVCYNDVYTLHYKFPHKTYDPDFNLISENEYVPKTDVNGDFLYINHDGSVLYGKGESIYGADAHYMNETYVATHNVGFVDSFFQSIYGCFQLESVTITSNARLVCKFTHYLFDMMIKRTEKNFERCFSDCLDSMSNDKKIVILNRDVDIFLPKEEIKEKVKSYNDTEYYLSNEEEQYIITEEDNQILI